MTETTILDFKLSNSFNEYRIHMNTPEQQTMFKEIGLQTIYMGVCKDDPQRATVIFQGPEAYYVTSLSILIAHLSLKRQAIFTMEPWLLVGMIEMWFPSNTSISCHYELTLS